MNKHYIYIYPKTPGCCMSGTASGAQITGTETGSRNRGFQFQDWSISGIALFEFYIMS